MAKECANCLAVQECDRRIARAAAEQRLSHEQLAALIPDASPADAVDMDMIQPTAAPTLQAVESYCQRRITARMSRNAIPIGRIAEHATRLDMARSACPGRKLNVAGKLIYFWQCVAHAYSAHEGIPYQSPDYQAVLARHSSCGSPAVMAELEQIPLIGED